MNSFPIRIFPIPVFRCLGIGIAVAALAAASICTAQSKPDEAQKPAADAAPDVLVLSNGDTLHGKFVSETAGKVTFHSDPLGDVSVSWDKIKEMHVNEKFAVLDKTAKLRGKKGSGNIPMGTLDVANQAITVHEENGAPTTSIPAKDAQYIMDEDSLNKQVYHQPSFFADGTARLPQGLLW